MAATVGEIFIKPITEVDVVKEFTFEQIPNRHPNAQVYASLKKEVNVEKILQQIHNNILAVERIEDNGNIIRLFSGYVKEVEIYDIGHGCYTIHLNLIGGSSQMDFEKKERSFQNVSDTHKDIINKVATGNANIIVEWNIGQEEQIGMPVIQYRETDWKFIQRMASVYHIPVIVGIETDKTVLSIGMKGGNGGELNKKFYCTGISSKFYELGGSKNGYVKNEFQYYKVKTRKSFQLGDRVIFNGKICYICGKWGELKNAEMVYTYELGRKKLAFVKLMENRNLIGHTILGTVLETKNETLKLDLHLQDDVHNNNVAYPYDWKPETGNILYCMPQAGTTASLYFADSIESSASVVNCIRTNGATSPNMDNPSNKHFKTEHKMNFDLEMDNINFSIPAPGTEKTFAKLKMIDDVAILFASKRDIHILAKEQVKFECEKFFWGSYQGIVAIAGALNKTPSSLDMNYQFNLLGNYTTICCEPSEEPYPIINDAPIVGKKPEAFSLETAKKGFWTGIANTLVATVTVCAIAAVVVATVGTGGMGAVVIGAAIGGITCGTFQAAYMYHEDVKNQTNTPVEEYASRCAIQATIGAVTGAVTGGIGAAEEATMALKIANVATDTVGNVGGEIAEELMTTGKLSKKDIVEVGIASLIMYKVPKIKTANNVTNTITTKEAMEGIKNNTKKFIKSSITSSSSKKSIKKLTKEVSDLESKKMVTNVKTGLSKVKQNNRQIKKKVNIKNQEIKKVTKVLEKQNKELKESKELLSIYKKNVENNIINKVNPIVDDTVNAYIGLDGRLGIKTIEDILVDRIFNKEDKSDYENVNGEIENDIQADNEDALDVKFSGWVEYNQNIFE